MDIDINPAVDGQGWLIARNTLVTDTRLARIAAMYTHAETDDPAVLNWVNRLIAEGRTDWLMLVGPVGTGKTHAAIAALRMAVRVPRTVVWQLATAAQMLDDFRPSGLDDADARYLRSDILVIDDLTMVKTNTEWAIEQLYRVINDRRINGRLTIITTNEPPVRLKELLNEQIVSRIVQSCDVIVLTGADRRRATEESP